eukprot:1160045-Pelagomonas_calceolata.AAC.7
MQATHTRTHTALLAVHCSSADGWESPHPLEEEVGVRVAGDLLVGLDDFFDLVVDEVVEGVNVLLH